MNVYKIHINRNYRKKIMRNFEKLLTLIIFDLYICVTFILKGSYNIMLLKTYVGIETFAKTIQNIAFNKLFHNKEKTTNGYFVNITDLIDPRLVMFYVFLLLFVLRISMLPTNFSEAV